VTEQGTDRSERALETDLASAMGPQPELLFQKPGTILQPTRAGANTRNTGQNPRLQPEVDTHTHTGYSGKRGWQIKPG